jgi:hypothetical protein
LYFCGSTGWIEIPSRLSLILVEAHFNPIKPGRRAILLYCPEWGNKEDAMIDPLHPTLGAY